MKRVMFLVGFLLCIQAAFSQNADVDALFKKIAIEKNENSRIDLINDFLVEDYLVKFYFLLCIIIGTVRLL